MKTIICEKWKQTLCKNFHIVEKMRIDDQFCDIKLKSLDGKIVKAHRNILTMRSNYFRGLFSSGMKDSTAECIDYNHIKGEILEKVIRFIYTGQLEISEKEEIEDIAVCGNYFELEDLTAECTELISKFIDNDNCLKYWRLAQECLQDKLEQQCISHILSSTKQLLETDEFFNELQEDEIKILLKDDRLNWLEEVKFEKILKWTKNNTRTSEEFKKMFLQLIENIDFTTIHKNFIISHILDNDDLVEHREIRKQIVKLLNHHDDNSQKNKKPCSVSNLVHSNKKLLAIIGDEMKFISHQTGNFITLQKKDNSLWGVGQTVFNNFLLITGGRKERDDNSDGTNFCEYFDSLERVWRNFPSMKIKRYWHASVYHENKIYACGGYSKCKTLKDVEIFDFNKEKWIRGQNLRSGRESFGIASINRSLYALGGYGTKKIEMLDSRTSDGWKEIVQRGFEEEDFTRCIPKDMDIYCFQCEEVPIIFDTRMNVIRKCNGENNEIPILGTDAFAVCTFNNHFNFIQYNDDDENYIDFYERDFKGNLIYSKPKAMYLSKNGPIGGLVALHY